MSAFPRKVRNPNPPIKGHRLRFAGRAFVTEGGAPREALGYGHGRCECGAMSPALYSNAQRKDWHREHKAAIRAERAERASRVSALSDRHDARDRAGGQASPPAGSTATRDDVAETAPDFMPTGMPAPAEPEEPPRSRKEASKSRGQLRHTIRAARAQQAAAHENVVALAEALDAARAERDEALDALRGIAANGASDHYGTLTARAALDRIGKENDA